MFSVYRVKELTLFDFYHSLTSLKGLLFIIPYFVFWYLILTNINAQTIEVLQSDQGLMLTSWLLADQELALQMFVDRSASLSLYLLIAVFVTPLFMLLAASNTYASDCSRGAFRFILTRATRQEIFAARILSSFLLVSICILVTVCWASIQAYLQHEDDLIAIAFFGFETYIIIIFYSLPYITFMAMVSSFARSGLGSLFLSMMLYVLLVIIILWLQTDYDYIVYLVPSSVTTWLFNINLQNVLISTVILLAYTFFYSSLAWYFFRRRDM